MPEDVFWQTTPAKFYALLDCHVESNSTGKGDTKQSKKVKEGYIDQINW